MRDRRENNRVGNKEATHLVEDPLVGLREEDFLFKAGVRPFEPDAPRPVVKAAGDDDFLRLSGPEQKKLLASAFYFKGEGDRELSG